ncbi:uncharacterized protein LOC144633095 isoform X1 [Oculina patagonica]
MDLHPVQQLHDIETIHSLIVEMDEPERHPKRRKIYESPQPAGMYTTSNQFPDGFEAQQSDQSCLRNLLKSTNQAGLTGQTNNHNRRSSESVSGFTPKQTIGRDHTHYNKSHRNEVNNGATVTVVMASGSRAPLAESTTYQAPRMLPEELNELEDINPTSLGQALRKELQTRAEAIQKVLSKHMFKVRSKMGQLERENKELRQYACSLDKTLRDVMKKKTAKMMSRETQVNMALEKNDLKVSRGTQVNMRVIFRPVLPNRKDAAIPRFLTLPSFHQDGSGKSQFVYLPANREISGSSNVSNEVNETSVRDHFHQNSNDKSLPGQKMMESGSNPQASTSQIEGIPKRTISAYQNVSSRNIITQEDERWISKSTDQANNHPRIDSVFSQASGLQIEEKTSSSSSYCEVPFGSVASKKITAQKDELWASKPTESVSRHTSTDKVSSQTAKTPIAERTSLISAYCNPSFGTMVSKETSTKNDEVLFPKSTKRVHNEAFYRSSYSVVTTNTSAPSVSEVETERAKLVSQLPKGPQKLPGALGDKTCLISNASPPNKCSKPDITSTVPQIRENEYCNPKDNLQNVPSGHSSSMKVYLTVDDPVRPGSDSGPFSIQRLLSNNKPTKESQVTNAPSSLPSQRESNLNKHEHLSGVSSSSLKGDFVRANDTVKPTPINIPSSRSSLQGCVQSSSPLSTSSGNTSSRVSTAGGHILHSLAAPLNGSLEHEKSGIHPAPLKTTSSNISQAVDKRNEFRQNAVSSNESSTKNIRTNTLIRQNSGNAHQSKSQIDFQSRVSKLSHEKTPQKKKPPVATVQAMTSFSNSLHVSSSVPSPERFNGGRNDSRPPKNGRNSTEVTRNTQQWRHKDPTVQKKRKDYNVRAMHFPGSTPPLFTPSQDSDLQTFVSYLTDSEPPNAGSVMKQQTFEASFDIGQESLFERHLTYYDSLEAQQEIEIFQNQSKRVWTLQPGDNWKNDDHSRMGTYDSAGIYPDATTGELLSSFDDNILQSQSYFSNGHSPADAQYTTNGFIPNGAHYNPQNGLHLEHCPMSQVNQHKNQQSHLHHSKQRGRPPYKQR